MHTVCVVCADADMCEQGLLLVNLISLVNKNHYRPWVHEMYMFGGFTSSQDQEAAVHTRCTYKVKQ